MSHLFVTGTGTGVGKTTVACAVLAAARMRGLSVTASKPVESGCGVRDGELWPEDAARLRAACGDHQTLASICPHRFEHALAPAVAAALVGSAVTFAEIEQAARNVLELDSQVCVVEGAGGLLVPLVADRLIVDLAVALGLPVVVVALAGLGTVNHTLLTVEALRARGLAIAGVVLNDGARGADPSGRRDWTAEASNASEIERFGKVEVLGVFPHLPDASPNELGAAAERELLLSRVFHVER